MGLDISFDAEAKENEDGAKGVIVFLKRSRTNRNRCCIELKFQGAPWIPQPLETVVFVFARMKFSIGSIVSYGFD